MVNKYQEAKSNIINTLTRQVGYKAYKNLYEEDLETLQELIDKATAKKIEEKIEIIGGYSFTNAVCPNCKEYINEVEGYAYCPICGQALDWGEAYE